MAPLTSNHHLTSNLARSPSPAPLDRLLSREDIPPLAYDTEAELLAVLSRLESELKKSIDISFRDGANGANRGEVEKVVLEEFFRGLAPLVWSNCTIAGLPYAQYQALKSKASTSHWKRVSPIPAKRDFPISSHFAGSSEFSKTKAFDEVLHQRVMNYQNSLFDAREQNARERVDVPNNYALGVQDVISRDMEWLSQLEAVQPNFSEDRPQPVLFAPTAAPQAKGRKSVGANKGIIEERPTAQQAQDDYAKASDEINRLLRHLPSLRTAAEQATRVALDTAALH
ncbi:BZ3500_MvSof-1268-A1-R1_Chr8-2g10201 [Microbotryum saponariae]|uniref:BZ3500_MvSof-1268-A1-R1_Chr8-2g10201 protein n=1 Tax=Microbotryum saponariae TaxID=289078 RepID=A0A2X0L5S8_9BASI|nr:BZ3500_MvSof-1268-A1-R1_Chr8-2g10201 [Microbotryum saponariae]SDA01994.1 BZ3501_MvSof-1269-A2-R1_Chr8-2g09951 [Microbotryum saponariae]